MLCYQEKLSFYDCMETGPGNSQNSSLQLQTPKDPHDLGENFQSVTTFILKFNYRDGSHY